jgi:hypothetical protein
VRKLVPALHKLVAPEFLELPGLHPLLRGKLSSCAGRSLSARRRTHASSSPDTSSRLYDHVGVVITLARKGRPPTDTTIRQTPQCNYQGE